MYNRALIHKAPIKSALLLKPATDDSQDVCEMRNTGEMQEKKGHALDNVKIIYIRFAIRLFSCTIILYLIARETPLSRA